MVEGFFYTFRYISYTENIFNLYPLIFFLGMISDSTKLSILGIDVVFIPPGERKTFLYLIYNLFKNWYDEEYENEKKLKERFVPKRVFTGLLKNFNELVKDRVWKIGNVYFNYALKAYDVKKVSNIKLIKFEDWNIIPNLPPVYVSNISESELYYNYYKAKHTEKLSI